MCFYMVGHPRLELGSLCLRGRTSPSKFIPHNCGTLERTRTSRTRDLNTVPIPIRLQGCIGAPSGTRTHRILILSQARIPIPSSGQCWRLWKDSNPQIAGLEDLLPFHWQRQNLCKYYMRLTKTQQEVYDQLMTIYRNYGKEYLFGWTLGLLIRLSVHDPNLRREIKKKSSTEP